MTVANLNIECCNHTEHVYVNFNAQEYIYIYPKIKILILVDVINKRCN